MKHISLKIFILMLVSGFMGIVGVFLLSNNIRLLSNNYRVIIDEHSENLDTTNEIRLLMSKHQSIVAQHIMASSDEKYDYYETEADELNNRLKAEFSGLGQKMIGGERETTFHAAYTAFCSYMNNAKSAIELSRGGKKNTANYYVVNVMDEQIEKVNSSFDNLDAFVQQEITDARAKMDRYISFSNVSALVCIPVIIIAMLISLFICVRLTSNMDKYKTKLESDIENKNAALHEHNERIMAIQNKTIVGLANLIESRDSDTGEHVKRTSQYVNILAKAAQKEGYHPEILTDNYIDLLTKAAPMHDIGKIAISDTILEKPGKLTAEEFEIMKTHAEQGGKIVLDVIGGIEAEDYVQIASDVATYHHEKWDGSGYCKGLSGENIPLSARIMAIADVFDALISKRCYKEPMPMEKAFGIIKESAGSHFDPTLANIFVSLKDEIISIANS